MSREIVLDTETTGLDPSTSGVIEIAAIELIDMEASGDFFQCFVNPGRPVGQGAFDVHGIGDEFLADKPKFGEIVDTFLKYIGNDTLVIHNANFDLDMLNAELARIEYSSLSNRVVDTLQLARQRLPGQSHSLDALCRYYQIDLSARDKHSALVDVKLLADVYNRLKTKQEEMRLKVKADTSLLSGKHVAGNKIVKLPSEEELSRHHSFIKENFSS